MGEPLACVFCESDLEPHCSNPDCTWDKCEVCDAYGDPARNLWRRPIQEKWHRRQP